MTHPYPCPPQAIIFDMDGLLVDSEKLWKIAETGWLADRGATYSDEKHAPFIGMALPEFVPHIRQAYGLDDDAETLLADLMQRIITLIETQTTPQPGAAQMVDYVASYNIPHAIASSSPMAVIEATLNSQPTWAEVFAVRCSADEVPNGKPAPDVYALAAERLGVQAAQCIALEDSRNGARAAVAAGMTCFVVPDLTHAAPSDFEEITPFVFATLHEALATIRGCYGG
jgi:HAD superfamily hydrolase (TIGR01509 family)